MRIKLDYTYEGFVPHENTLKFCLYLSPEGELSFGLARSEYNTELNVWQWNKEIGKGFHNIPPFAYMSVEGEVDDVLEQLKKAGYAVLGLQEKTDGAK